MYWNKLLYFQKDLLAILQNSLDQAMFNQFCKYLAKFDLLLAENVYKYRSISILLRIAKNLFMTEKLLLKAMFSKFLFIIFLMPEISIDLLVFLQESESSNTFKHFHTTGSKLSDIRALIWKNIVQISALELLLLLCTFKNYKKVIKISLESYQ